MASRNLVGLQHPSPVLHRGGHGLGGGFSLGEHCITLRLLLLIVLLLLLFKKIIFLKSKSNIYNKNITKEAKIRAIFYLNYLTRMAGL